LVFIGFGCLYSFLIVFFVFWGMIGLDKAELVFMMSVLTLTPLLHLFLGWFI